MKIFPKNHQEEVEQGKFYYLDRVKQQHVFIPGKLYTCTNLFLLVYPDEQKVLSRDHSACFAHVKDADLVDAADCAKAYSGDIGFMVKALSPGDTFMVIENSKNKYWNSFLPPVPADIPVEGIFATKILFGNDDGQVGWIKVKSTYLSEDDDEPWFAEVTE